MDSPWFGSRGWPIERLDSWSRINQLCYSWSHGIVIRSIPVDNARVEWPGITSVRTSNSHSRNLLHVGSPILRCLAIWCVRVQGKAHPEARTHAVLQARGDARVGCQKTTM